MVGIHPSVEIEIEVKVQLESLSQLLIPTLQELFCYTEWTENGKHSFKIASTLDEAH